MAVRCVAMIDILGFKHLVENDGTPEVARRIKRVFSTIHRIHWGWSSTDADQIGRATSGVYKPVAYEFSDTILTWSPRVVDISQCSTYEQCYRAYFGIACWFHYVGHILIYGLHHKLPMRAGIAFGECEINKSKRVFVGKPIIDAHDLEESQDWIGCAIHRNCNDVIQAFSDPMLSSMVFKPAVISYDEIQLKSSQNGITRGDLSSMVVDWLGHSFDSEQDADSGFPSPKRLRYLIELGETHENEEVRRKYTNTLKFFDYCKSRHV